eukprot:SAG22_NODE_2379_length_2633_cov_2.414759_2_plen_470_part_00
MRAGVFLLACLLGPLQLAAAGKLADELAGMKISQLRKQAITVGATEAEVEEALDADKAKEELIELILEISGDDEPEQKGTPNVPEPPTGADWKKPEPLWRPAKPDYTKRYNAGTKGSAQQMLNFGVWFVNTTKHGPRGSGLICAKAIEMGADLSFTPKDNGGQSALMQACTAGADIEVIQTLIDAGADLSQRDFSGFTPIDAAVQGARMDIIDLLLAKSENFNINERARDGYSPIHRLLGGLSPRFGTALQSILDAGANPKLKSQQGFPPIVLCPMGDMRRSLIKAGACMPKWYKRMTENGECDQEPMAHNGHEFCQEEPLCLEIADKSDKSTFAGSDPFKMMKDTPVADIGDFNAPGFITEQPLRQMCPCSCDVWIAPEMCPEEVSEEEYAYLTEEFRKWEAKDGTGGVPGPRAIPPVDLLEFQAEVQRQNPAMYAKHDTRPTEPSQHQKAEAKKKAAEKKAKSKQDL